MKTGNQGITTAPLTEVEKKIVSLIGVEDCPDSMPEEETLQHEMEAEVEMIEVISLSECNEYKLLETEGDQASPAPLILASGSRATAVASPAPNEQQVQEETMQSPAPQITVVTSPPTLRQESTSRIRNLNPHQTAAEQANVGYQDFLANAKSNAESMRMLAAATEKQAEAAKTQAEAAKIQAEAAKMQAEAAKAQTEASLLIAQAANKIADALILFVSYNKK